MSQIIANLPTDIEEYFGFMYMEPS